jgi:hypothetical protein
MPPAPNPDHQDLEGQLETWLRIHWARPNRSGVYQLGADGRYAPQTASRILTGFPIAEAQRVLSQIGTASETALVKSFRRWVRENPDPGFSAVS